MPKITELTIDRAKVLRGTIRVLEDGRTCPLGHYRLAAQLPLDMSYQNIVDHLGEFNVREIWKANDDNPRWGLSESQILRANEPNVIAAFKEAGVTVTYVGEYL